MKHAKLPLSLLLCLLVCLCLLPAAHADGGTAEPMGTGEAMLPLYAQTDSLPLPAEEDQALAAELTLRFETGAEAAFRLPDSLKAIVSEAFADCRKITSVYIPASVKHIYEGAFSGCTNLKTVNMRGCSALIEILASKGALRSIDLTGCTALQYLVCWNNKLTSVNLSQNTALKRVNLSANHDLSSVTLGSLQNLEMLWVQNTGLTRLNISKCPLIVQAYRYGTVTDFGREGLQRDGGNWVGYQYGDGLNPGSSSPVDHCQFCVDKGVSITA